MTNAAPIAAPRRSTATAALAACVIFLALLPACAELSNFGTPPASSTTSLTSLRDLVPRDDAALQLRNARCSRDVACDSVGPDHRFSSLDRCLDDRGADSAAYFAPCGLGAAAPKLDACMAAVRAQPCGPSLDRVDHLLACRVDDICMRF